MIVNLIPMAGEGKRYKDRGYLVPKPLIEINGKPMIVLALESLPKASKNILIVRKDILNVFELRTLLNKYFKNITIIEIDYLTDGQASTCLLAEKVVPEKSIINIGACDVGFVFNRREYQKKLNNYESFIWTYRNNKNVLKYPNMYGWVEIKKETEEIEYVSCKKPISMDLLNDHVVSGTFTFKNSDNFFNAIRKMINKNDKINNEFYLDNIFNHLNQKSAVFEIENYYSWGTPDELNNYLNNEI